MRKQSRDSSTIHRFKDWFGIRREVLQFIVIFTLALGGFSFILERDSVQQSFVSPHLAHVASLCGKVLNLAGTSCDANGPLISSTRFSVQIVKGCESLYPTAMLWAAMIAYPSSWRWKLMGIVGGAIILFILNVVRVISMFYIGIFFPSLFDMVHIYAWQALFILLTLGIWLLWAAKASKTNIADIV
ncbi:MAG: exosortase H [Ignavibacteria bacterium]|nr:exosortase H [Ignavibacteria bacterium]